MQVDARSAMAKTDAYLPLIMLLVSLLIILGGVYVSQQPLADPNSNEPASALSIAATFFGVAQTDRITALLRASNIATIAFGIWFYLANESNRIIKSTTVIVLFSAYALNYWLQFHHKVNYQSRLLDAYIFSLLIIGYFCIVDYIRSRQKSHTGAALAGFSSLYISLPALISLIIAFLVHSYIIDDFSNDTEKNSSIFLAGVGTAILFYSNVVFALVALPWYAPRIIFTQISDSDISLSRET